MNKYQKEGNQCLRYTVDESLNEIEKYRNNPKVNQRDALLELSDLKVNLEFYEDDINSLINTLIKEFEGTLDLKIEGYEVTSEIKLYFDKIIIRLNCKKNYIKIYNISNLDIVDVSHIVLMAFTKEILEYQLYIKYLKSLNNKDRLLFFDEMFEYFDNIEHIKIKGVKIERELWYVDKRNDCKRCTIKNIREIIKSFDKNYSNKEE